ncbi:MAG: Gfo/Idh/MocA family oxidoreductase [Deltaproteobacteria bacterium]|nr:Gfo/Idh/MocA family oxidoreductase [Deltaproteobacteria bacterium]
MSIPVALIGCGRWGSELVDAVNSHRHLNLKVVADSDTHVLSLAAALAPQAELVPTLTDALSHDVEAAIIATPSATHAALAREALEAGLDVLVEKPLALEASDAKELCTLAYDGKRIAMVGHVLRYHPCYERLIALVRGGVLGQLRHLGCIRLTQSGSPDPLWTLAPHDLATLVALDSSDVDTLDLETNATHGDETVTKLHVRLESGVTAALTLSTTAKHPERLTRAEGEDGTLGFDELDPRGAVNFAPPGGEPQALPCEVSETCHPSDALCRELDHFAECVWRRVAPRTSFAHALKVVDIIERAQAPQKPSRRGKRRR